MHLQESESWETASSASLVEPILALFYRY